MAADSTIFRTVNRFMALSFGTQREQFEHRTGSTLVNNLQVSGDRKPTCVTPAVLVSAVVSTLESHAWSDAVVMV